MDQTKAPFDDLLVRAGHDPPRVQPMALSVNGFYESLETADEHDPDQTRRLLAEAGHADGVAGTIHVASYAPLPTVAQSVQADLAEVGIDVEIEPFGIRQLVTQYAKSDRTRMVTQMAYPEIEPVSALKWFLDNPSPCRVGSRARLRSRSHAWTTRPCLPRSGGARAHRRRVRGRSGLLRAAVPWLAGDWCRRTRSTVSSPAPRSWRPLGGQDLRHLWLSE